MEALPLFKNNKERVYFSLFIFIILISNLYLHFIDYNKITKNEVFSTNAIVVNSYEKNNYTVLKLKTDDFTFFTSSKLSSSYEKLQHINIFIVTKNITFYQYLKGFYAKSFNITKLESSANNTSKIKIANFISTQHLNKDISSLYNALFLAIPINEKIREVCSSFGISHLVAISGFHLGVISFVLYFLIHILYCKMHQNYFPYRNKRFDISIIVSLILFCYLLFVDLVPSLLRAFVMFVFALLMLRNNIKVLSFETLFIVVVIILALFPKLFFSLSLWFSVAGVFYIFLFLHYFSTLNKYIQFIIFNFWIYFAINPIVHYFFGATSFEQLYSPILTILFTLFYPLVVFLHLIQSGSIFDSLLSDMINYQIYSVEVFTPFLFLLFYISISLISIFNKKAFILLNVLLLSFGVFLFIQI